MLINLEDLNTYIQNQIEKALPVAIEKALPAAVERVLSDPDNPMFLNAVENVLAISDHKILKRLFEHDILLGLKEPFDNEEERSPNLPEQIKELSDRIEQPLNNTTEETIQDFYIPHTTLDLKASELVEYLKEDVKPRNNEVFLNSREIIHYLKTFIPEELRLKDITNPRQAKKDILERAVKMFPNIVCIVKNKSGNKVTGIALTQSAKRMYTDTC
jgi:hypothetical protein